MQVLGLAIPKQQPRHYLNSKIKKGKMSFEFGKKSTEQLNTLHPDLIKVFNLALSRSKVDFGISIGYRSIEEQQADYAIGRTVQLHRKPVTNVDGVRKVGMHNHNPSLAADIYIYHPVKKTREKIIWNESHLAYVAGIIDACAQELHKKGEIAHLIRWGANWDGDGVIAFDQGLDDYPHFELI